MSSEKKAQELAREATPDAPRVIAVSPPGNWAVEQELRAVIGAAARIEFVPFDVVGAGSYEQDLLQRIRGYLDTMEGLLAAKIAVPPAVLVLGHTGCSYLAETQRPGWLDAVLQDSGASRVVTAVGAVEDVLRARSISRVELVTPYPPSVHGLACQYWHSRGLDVVLDGSMAGVNGARSIYDLTESDVAEFIRARAGLRIGASRPDAIVISGTGAPSLGVLDELTEELGLPVISVNRSMGRAVVDHLHAGDGEV